MIITADITEKLAPKMCLFIYKSNKDKYYIECHNVADGKLEAGYPLREDTLSDMVEYFSDKKKETYLKGSIPKNLLFADWSAKSRILVWYQEPEERMMYFSKDLNIKNGRAWQPRLIFVLDNSKLSVHACMSFDYLTWEDPLSYDEPLCRAPYHNVDSYGNVCLGSAKIKKPIKQTYAGVIEHYSNLFWNSEFSHITGNESPINGNLNTYWKEAIKDKRIFDYSVLIPSKKLTLKKLINDLS